MARVLNLIVLSTAKPARRLLLPIILSPRRFRFLSDDLRQACPQ